jgi:Spy/CpxP family protein refolding chaperone
MKTSTKLIFGFLASGVIAMGGIAYAHTQTTGNTLLGNNFKPSLFGKIASLGITDTQQQQIRTVLQSHSSSIKPLADQYIEARRDLRNTILKTSSTEDEVRAQAQKVADLEISVAIQKAYVAHDVEKVLTPEQMKKVQELIADVDGRVDEARDRIAQRIAGL